MASSPSDITMEEHVGELFAMLRDKRHGCVLERVDARPPDSFSLKLTIPLWGRELKKVFWNLAGVRLPFRVLNNETLHYDIDEGITSAGKVAPTARSACVADILRATAVLEALAAKGVSFRRSGELEEIGTLVHADNKERFGDAPAYKYAEAFPKLLQRILDSKPEGACPCIVYYLTPRRTFAWRWLIRGGVLAVVEETVKIGDEDLPEAPPASQAVPSTPLKRARTVAGPVAD